MSRRELVEDVRFRVEDLKDMGREDGETYCKVDDPESIRPDSEKFQNEYDSYTDDKVTVLTYYYRNRDTKTIWCIETTENQIIREAYDTGLSLLLLPEVDGFICLARLIQQVRLPWGS